VRNLGSEGSFLKIYIALLALDLMSLDNFLLARVKLGA